MLRSRRLALVAATLLLGLSACGTAATSAPAGNAPAVIHLGASKQSTNTAAGAPAVGDSMARIQNLHYLFDGTVPTLASSAAAWSLPAGSVPSDADIARIAAALGVKGDVQRLKADQGGGWIVGPADYSTPTLSVANDGLLSWNYSGTNSAVVGVSCGEAGSGTAGSSSGSGGAATPTTALPNPAPSSQGPQTGPAIGSVVPPDSVAKPIPIDTVVTTAPCAPPTPPANVPDKATAEAKAKDLLATMGYDASLYSFDTTADQWNASVTAYRLVGGQRSALQVTIGFGGEGVVQWASGTLAEPKPATEYPIVTVADGITRLNDPSGRWIFLGGGPGGIRPMAADSVGGAATTAAAGGAPAGTAVTPNSAVGAPVPPMSAVPVSEPSGTVPPVDVHLTKVALGLTTVWAQDGTVWLLPAFVFTAADGGQYTVVAVDEKYLDASIVAPATTVAGTVVTGSVVTGTAVPPVSAPPATSAAPPTTVTPGTVVHPGLGTVPQSTGITYPSPYPTALPAPVSIDAAKSLAGLTLDQATVLATQKGWTVRVSQRDGINLPVTADYSPTRVNVSTTTKSGVETVFDVVSIG
jgi:hypothetical protein